MSYLPCLFITVEIIMLNKLMVCSHVFAIAPSFGSFFKHFFSIFYKQKAIPSDVILANIHVILNSSYHVTGVSD